MVDQTGTVILTEDNDLLDVGDILTMGTEVAYPQVTKTIKELPIKHGLDGTEKLIVEDNEATKQAPLGTIVDEIKQNSQEKIREIESDLAQTNAQLSQVTNFNLSDLVKTKTLDIALAEAQSQMVDGRIFVPKGEYHITNQIIISKPIVIEFEPNTIIRMNSSNVGAIRVNANNVTLKNCKIIGSVTRNDISYGLTIAENVSDVNVNNILFSNFTGGIMLISQNRNIVVDACKFYNLLYPTTEKLTGGYGIVMQSSINCSVLNCRFDSTVERHCIYCGRNPQKLDLCGENNIISNNIFIGEKEKEPITGNEFLCKIMGNQNVTITGNVFDGGVGHVWLTSLGTVNQHCDGVTIVGNTFKNIVKSTSKTSAAIGNNSDLPLSGGVYSKIYNATITGNTIINCDCIAGIRADRIENSIISNNVINNLTGHGCYVTNGTKNTSINNNIIKSCERGVQIIGKDDYKEICYNNNLFDDNLISIYLADIANVTVKDNIIKSKLYQCLFFIDCNLDLANIHGNTLLKGNNAITFESSCTGNVFCYDNVYGNQTVNLIENKSDIIIKRPLNVVGIRQNVEFYADGKPTTGTWKRGDICKLNNPDVGGWLGYICTNGGTPGTWKGFGQLES
jgi:hypothetical protein